MAYTGDQVTHSFKFASAMGAFLPVRPLPPGSSLDETVIPAASINDQVIGLTRGTVGTYGLADAVVVGGVAKAVAAASLGAGAYVGIASTNGALGPVGPSGLPAHVGSGGAIEPKFKVGVSLHDAAAGGTFSVLVDPDQII